MRQRQPHSGHDVGTGGQAKRLQRRRGGEVFRADHVERPQHDAGGQAIAAGDVAVELAVGGVEIGAARDAPPVAQRRIGEWRDDLSQHRRGRRRQIVRHQLLEQIAGEFRELVLQLELHAGGEKRRALEQARNHRVHPVGDQAAKPLSDAGILVGELARLLIQQLELPIVEIEKFPVHRRSQPVDHDLAAVDLDVGDEFDRHVHWLARQVRAHDEAHLEVGGIDRTVAR